MAKKKRKKETIDEKLSKIKPDFYFRGKRVEWKEIKNKTIDEIQSSPDYTGNFPPLWQENMK